MSWSRGWQQDEWKSKSWEESTEVQDPWSNYGKAQDAGNWGSHKQDDWHGREDASWKQEQDPWGAWKKSGKDDWKEQDPWSRGRNDKENDPWSRSRNDKDVWGGYKNSCDDRQDNSWSRFSSSRDDRQDAWGQSRDDRQDSWGRQREVKEDPWGSYQKDSYQKDSYQKDSYGKDSWSRSDRQEDNRWSQDQGGWDKDGSQDRWGKAQDSWSRNDRQEDNSWSRNDRQEDSWSKNDGQEDPWGSYGRQDGQDNSWSNAKKDSWGTTTTGWTAREAYAGKLLEVDWAARPPMVEVKKNFYGEGFANVLATQRSDEEAQEIRRAANISIEHGESEAHPVPNPINSFDEACFDAELMGKITEQNFKEPTPVQKQIWPLAMQGRDVVGIAETGSGKTIAYLLPMIVHITYQSELQAGDGPVGLVLAPTRELAKQIKEECDTYASLKGLVTENVVGGIEKWDQKRRIQEKNDIIVATPGRFMQALDEEWIQLNRTSFVVLDEADEMLRKDFSEQIQKILGQVRRERQVLMFSATWPEEVENLAQQICTASEGMPPVYVRIGENKMAACRYIEQMTVVVDGEEDKYEKLLDSLKKSESIGSDKAIIFCRSRSTVQTLVDKLKEDEFFWEEGKCKVEALHGEMKQMDRDWVMQQFRKEDLPLVVSTGVLARGHDIPKVRFVFNYDLPREPEDYIHRVGRTGRAGAKGYAKTFVDRKSWKEMESACSFLKTVFQNTSQTIEPDFQELIDNYDNANQEWPAEAVQDGQAWSGEAAEAWSGEATQQEWSGEAAQQAEAWSGEATQQEWSGEAAQQAEAWSGEATQQEWSGEAAQQAEAWSGEATQQEWSGVAQQAEAWSGEATQQGRWRKAAAAQAEEERRAATEATEATDAQEPTATSAAEVAAWQAQAATSAADEAAWQGQTSATAVDEAAWQEQAASDAAWQAQAQAQAAQAQVWNGESEEAWASAGDWNQADVVRAQAVTTWTAEAGDPAWEMAQWQGVSWETYCGNAMYYYDQWQHERNSQWTAGAEEGQGTWPGPATVEAEPFVLATDDVGEVIKVPEEAKAVENGAEVPEATADAKAPASEAAADATQAEEIAASKASDAAAVAVEASEAVPEATEAPMDALAPHPPEALEVLAALVKASGPPPGLEGEKDDLKEFEGFWDGSEGATAAAPEVQSAGCPVISIDQDPPKRDSQETEPKAEAEAEQAQCPEGTALEKTEETEAVSEVDAEKATEVPDAEVEESGKAVPEVDAEKGSEDPKDEPLAVAASWQ
ncbi:unnamed protein product [Effrenium voratum]|uniref:RNA helicase n=1 Tax=Effrenium voratum TaxID=2562239 RepID=A0AA36MRP5_9DINO|nr:unnamed protein product [Effrenium voratum]